MGTSNCPLARTSEIDAELPVLGDAPEITKVIGG
jgi:hypothetical protein